MSSLLQLPLLRDRWKLILFGACFQYVHGISTQLAHRMHQPANQPLHDIGFSLLPVSHPLSFFTVLLTGIQSLVVMPVANLHTRICRLADMLGITAVVPTGAWSEE